MNIAYIVGNGLDLQYNLKTKYKDFYDYQIPLYEEKKSSENYINYIYEELKKDKENNFENWADFESGIGDLTHSYFSDKDTQENFIFHFSDVIDDLREYLKTQENNFEVKNKKIDFSKTLTNLLECLPEVYKNTIINKYSEFSNSHDIVYILSCNYTSVLDKLYNNSKTSDLPPFRNVDYTCSINPIIHIHGELDSSPILGVNDLSQLSDKILDENVDFFIKTSIMESLKEDQLNKTKDAISSASIIIIFGMSLGSTDKYLWNLISNHSINYDIPIILHSFVEDTTAYNQNHVRKIQKNNEIVDNFIQVSGINDDNLTKKLKNNIIPVIGEKIFEIVEENSINNT